MTGFHEILQSAPQVAHQAKELIDLEMRSNLLQKLIESGHPYGLLLSQSNASSANESSESLINFFFPAEKGEIKANPGIGNVEISFSICSPMAVPAFLAFWSLENARQFFGSASINALFSKGLQGIKGRWGAREGHENEWYKKDEDEWEWGGKDDLFHSITAKESGILLTAISKGSVLGSAKKNENLAQKLHLEQVFTHQAFLAPIFLKAIAGEKESMERTREFVVGQNGVGLGTAAVKLGTFKGQGPFTIKSPKGEEIVQVNPGDPIGHIHLSHQAGQLRYLSPMEKVSIMIEDLRDLFSAIDQPIETELKLQQQETLIKARSATIIGISHLVRLFSRKTGLPTWKIDVLPELVQRFHQHDSQAVSSAFGGTRKVKPEDVEMTVITPQMRQALVTTTL